MTHAGESANAGRIAQRARHRLFLHALQETIIETTLQFSALANPAELARQGFIRYSARDFRARLQVSDFERSFAQLRSAFSDLPPDPYAPGSNRHRRYGRAIVLPGDRTLRWLPLSRDDELGDVTEYYQGEHNPEHRGARRRFPAIGNDLRENDLLQAIVLADLDQTLWLERFDNSVLHVGVHLVKLVANGPDAEAISSPNVLHQDGEPFTFAHLISQHNLDGGVNFIAPPRCAGLMPDELRDDVILDRFTLDAPLDSYAVHDARVCHYVSPVRQLDRASYAERSVLLVDFTQLVPQI